MFVTVFVTLGIAIALATLLLITFGHRVRVSAPPLGWLLAIGLTFGAGEVASRVWRYPPGPILGAVGVVAVLAVVVCIFRRSWNPIGQAFLAIFGAAALSYILFAGYATFGSGMPLAAVAASFVLMLLETIALSLAGYFVFEGCDVICRTEPARPEPTYDASYQPMVALQVPSYNEPPDMLIDTIKSLEGIDYERFEIIVIDNNTEDESFWRPVEEYCRDRPRVKFIHVEGLEGFKAGALNLVDREHLDPQTEFVGIIDADYRVDPHWLKDLMGYFADPKVAFVQTPQDYREWDSNAYMRACYDAYDYFFVTSMPSRMQRNSIIFAGTMGLMRLSALNEIGGWPEWCITEDAETSLRLLKRGYDGVYINKKYGKGIMPLTFSAFKSQRFRWAFGGIQIFRKHFRDLLPGRRTPDNQLTLAQRLDYFMSGVLWFNDVLYLGFSLILIGTAFVVASGRRLELRPLHGGIVVLPLALIASGLIRALWALRVRAHLKSGRGLMAFLNWLSVSWTVALACIQHLFRSESSFLRTPKEGKENSLLAAFRAARVETAFAVVLWGAPFVLALLHRGTPFLYVLFGWQGLVYASAPIMSVMNVRAELTPELERRRRTEARREHFKSYAPLYGAASLVMVVALGFFAFGGSQADRGHVPSLLRAPERSSQAADPFSFIKDKVTAPASTAGPASSVVPSEVPVGDEPTAAPATEPPATAAPATDPPVTDAPATRPPRTQHPATPIPTVAPTAAAPTP